MSIWDTLASTMAVVSRTLTYATGLSFLALAILSPRSRRARLYLNVAAYVGSLGVCSVWGVMVSIVLSLIPGQRLKINKVVARSFYLLAGTLTGIRFEVEGEHHFAQARPAVLVGNHQTGIDILYLGRIFPNFASIMAKQELKYAPLLGQYSGCPINNILPARRVPRVPEIFSLSASPRSAPVRRGLCQQEEQT